MISAWLFSCGAPARDHPVRKNPIAALKKETASNCIDIASSSPAQSSLTGTGLLGGKIPPITTAPRVALKQQNGCTAFALWAGLGDFGRNWTREMFHVTAAGALPAERS